MKGFMVFALAVLLLFPLSAVACDGNAGFAFQAPVYSQGFAVQAVPVYQSQVFAAAPVYGNSFGNVFAVRNRGFNRNFNNRNFNRGFRGQNFGNAAPVQQFNFNFGRRGLFR